MNREHARALLIQRRWEREDALDAALTLNERQRHFADWWKYDAESTGKPNRREWRAIFRKNYVKAAWYEMDQMRRLVNRVFKAEV